MDGPEEELDALERIICGQKKPGSLDFQLLRRLTGNFSDDSRIGEGGCGEVYKGVLPSGKVIAVKKLKKDYQNIIDEKMFLREVDSMIKADHQNIVHFLGYCSEIKEKAVQMDDGNYVMAEEREKLLCFQYMSKGSLDKYLTDELRGFEWHTRYKIIKGICDGLFYLHHHKEKSILHMDLKPANILLGEQMVPKITDFGLSRIDGKTQITSAPRKYSQGYCAPEYIRNGERSCKSDIYSLGVLMIELLTGSKKMPNTTKVLRRWRHRWNKSSKHTPLWYLQVKKCLELAVRCQEINPVNRPFILDIVRELNSIHHSWDWDGKIRESSLEKIISSSDDMLGIEPLELHFTLAHNKQISSSVELANNTDYYIAFRIVTTSVPSFSIKPNKGIAAPRSRCRTTITLPAQEMEQLQNHRKKESIVVQSTRIDGNLTAADITVDMFNEENDDGHKVVDEVNLAVFFDMLHEEQQKDQANLSAEMGSLGTLSQAKSTPVFRRISVSREGQVPLWPQHGSTTALAATHPRSTAERVRRTRRKSEDCCYDLLYWPLCFGIVSVVIGCNAVFFAAFCFVRQIGVSVEDASLTRFELATSPLAGPALSYNLSLALAIRNPNWAMSLENTKPLEALYKFDDQTFDWLQLADKGHKHPAGKTRVYHLSAAGTTRTVTLGKAAESEFRKENATGTFEVEVTVFGEVKYMGRKPKCKVEASCPLKLQLAPPGTAAVVFQKVKCKLTKPEKYCG